MATGNMNSINGISRNTKNGTSRNISAAVRRNYKMKDNCRIRVIFNKRSLVNARYCLVYEAIFDSLKILLTVLIDLLLSPDFYKAFEKKYMDINSFM